VKKKGKMKTTKTNSLFCFQMYAVRGGKLNLKGTEDDSSHSKKRKKHSSSTSKKHKSAIDNEEDDGEQDFVQ
jgi:hypothetical protein